MNKIQLEIIPFEPGYKTSFKTLNVVGLVKRAIAL
jgi:hypothetical protein